METYWPALHREEPILSASQNNTAAWGQTPEETDLPTPNPGLLPSTCSLPSEEGCAYRERDHCTDLLSALQLAPLVAQIVTTPLKAELTMLQKGKVRQLAPFPQLLRHM